MTNFRGYAVPVAGTCVLIAALVLASDSPVESQPASRPAAPVHVVNTAAEPVPVVGTIEVGGVSGTVQSQQAGAWDVGILGSPTVSAQQSGPWNVGISGTPTVEVGNSTANPVPVQMVSGGQPFNGSVRVTLPHGISGRIEHIALPPGKALMMEHVMIRGWYRNNQHARPVVLTSDAAGAYHREFPTTTVLDTTLSQLFATGSHSVRIYTTSLGLNVLRSNPDDEAVMDLVVSGYLVDR
jgi:hypothetical protein